MYLSKFSIISIVAERSERLTLLAIRDPWYLKGSRILGCVRLKLKHLGTLH